MPTFAYLAIDPQGKEQRGQLAAADATAAGTELRGRGLYPTSLTPVAGSTPTPAALAARRSGPSLWRRLTTPSPRLSSKGLVLFTRQLATLLDAGLPLVRALRTLEDQESDVAAQRAIARIAEQVEGGMTFSEALAAQPKSFDRLYVNMIRAGEASGALEQVLARLADYMEKAARLRSKVKGALVYPVVVLSIALLITAGLMIFIVPKFTAMFTEMMPAAALPLLTQWVMAISSLLAHQWYIVALAGVGVYWLFHVVRATRRGGYLLDFAALKTPPFNRLVAKSSVARYCSTLSTLLSSGVSILSALQIVRDTTGNAVVSQAVQVVHDAVKEGESMAKPMKSTQVFPKMAVSMVQVGEETGALPEMLQRVAKIYEDEVDTTVDAMTSLIEPLMIVLLGVLIGGIVLAMFLPLFGLIGGMSGS